MPPKLAKQTQKSGRQTKGIRKRELEPNIAAAKKSKTTKPYKVCDVSRTNRKGMVAASLVPQAKKSKTTKPYKVCDVSRTKRKGLVAASLDDLRAKVAAKFGITDDEFDIVLEDDCTVVGDEDYFETLSENALLMVLKGNERTHLEDHEDTDLALEATLGEPGEQSDYSEQDSSQLARIAGKLSRNLSALVTLPDTEAQIIAEADRNKLQVLLRQPMDIVRDIQHTCIQRLSDRETVKDAVDLLKLYHRAKSQEDGQGNDVTDGRRSRSKKR